MAQRKHPAELGSIAEHFAREQPQLRAISATFDGYVEQMMRVSSTCLVRVDRNRYSVPSEWAGKAVSVRSSATQIHVVANGQTIAEHPRSFAREQLVCDPWHYLAVLEKKPGTVA